MARLAGIFALCGLLLGCSGTGEPDYATIDVELSYLERIALPPGAFAVAALRQTDSPANGPADHPALALRGPGTVIAQQSSAIAASVPVTISLRYDRRLLDPARALVADGWIYADDQVLFAIPEPPQVQPHSSQPARLVLRRLRHVAYTCADKTQPSVAFPLMGGDLAFLERGGTAPIALRAQPVGSGYHYDGGGFNLRGKGTEADLKRPDGGTTRCIASPS